MLMAVELGKGNLAEQASDERMGQVALKGFFAIARQWKLKPGEQRTLLGDLPATTFNRYKQLPQVALNRDLMERISYILGIHKALRILFHDADGCDQRCGESCGLFEPFLTFDVGGAVGPG